jgi:serine/threonine-protein kinase
MGRYTTTPGVINLSVAQARQKVQAAGLDFEAGARRYSETVAAGSVISTDPEAGSRILNGGTVTAVVSRGPERHEVPVLRGRTVEQAKAALKQRHLTFGDTTRRFNGRVAKGTVVSSDPESGTELRRGAAVDLVVSRGPAPSTCPTSPARTPTARRRS